MLSKKINYLSFKKKTMSLNIVIVLLSLVFFNADRSPNFVFLDDRNILARFKAMLVDIRNQNITPATAEAEFVQVMKDLRDMYPNAIDSSEIEPLVFPLVASHISAVGGAGRGFYARKFNLFDHSVRGSHPAHDIFIYDPDQDCKDNRKKDYVDIVSVGHGLVLATEKNWSDTSAYRGGNYVWVYDFERGGLWYYAHHRKVVVEPGQILKAGDKIGEVGRTGANAFNKRSDTHLHLMYLQLDANLLPKPINYYPWLFHSKVILKSTQAQPSERSIIRLGFLKSLQIGQIQTRFKPWI
jgi:peptidoglycan LD-endopeptidase LytH